MFPLFIGFNPIPGGLFGLVKGGGGGVLARSHQNPYKISFFY